MSILPADSEHSAIFQCIQASQHTYSSRPHNATCFLAISSLSAGHKHVLPYQLGYFWVKPLITSFIVRETCNYGANFREPCTVRPLKEGTKAVTGIPWVAAYSKTVHAFRYITCIVVLRCQFLSVQ